MSFSQEYKIIESDENHIIIEFNFNNNFTVEDFLIDGIQFTKIYDYKYPVQLSGNPYLPTRFFDIGIPLNTNALVTVINIEREVIKDKFVISTPDSADQSYETLKYNQEVYGNNALFPLETATINSEGVYRFIKSASVSIAPFQFNPVERILIINKKSKLE